MKYVQNNALKGRTFGSLAEQNQFLDQWEARVADTRIHGTVSQQVEALFEKQERPALQPVCSLCRPRSSRASTRPNAASTGAATWSTRGLLLGAAGAPWINGCAPKARAPASANWSNNSPGSKAWMLRCPVRRAGVHTELRLRVVATPEPATVQQLAHPGLLLPKGTRTIAIVVPKIPV